MTLLPQLVAVSYVVFGMLGLFVISVSDNRQDMFLLGSAPWLGFARVAHAYVTLFILIACGLAVWFWPQAVALLAWAAFVLILIGKLPNLALGHWRSCKRCVVVGPLMALLATAVLVSGRV